MKKERDKAISEILRALIEALNESESFQEFKTKVQSKLIENWFELIRNVDN